MNLFITYYWLTNLLLYVIINISVYYDWNGYMIETFEEFENWLITEECFDNHDVSHIDNDCNQHYLEHSEYISYLGQVTVLLANRATIKVEQAEKLFDYNDRTIHLFYNDVDGPSFK